MKISAIRRKAAMSIGFFIFLGLSVIKLNAQTTITSTGTGGNWSSAATWVGNVVPTAGNNVVINSTVYADGNKTCNNLTINAGAYLYNLYTAVVSVTGSVLNNGSILNNPTGYPLSLIIQGNIANNGAWSINSTTLSGLLDQTITEAVGMKFEGAISMTDSLGDVVLGSDVLVNNNTWDLNKSTIKTNGHRLLSLSYNFINGKIISNDTLVLNNTYLDNIQFFGNYKLNGNVYSKSYSNVFNGTLTVLDTLANLYTSHILVNGDIVNKGSIINNPTGYPLHLNIAGNISNEGIWSVNTTNLVGITDQTIQQTQGKSFQGIINTTDSIGDIILASNVMLESNTWEMNKSILHTNGHKLLSNNYNLNNGKIISDDTLALNNSYIDNIQFFGNYKLDGNIYSKNYTNVFNDTVTVLDTLANLYTSHILVNGDIVNKGSIINNPTGYPLHLNIAGNIRNEGIWRVHTTNFVGITDQTIQQTQGKSFQGIINTTDSIGDIILASDVMLESNTWNFNNSILRTNGHKLISNSYNLINGKIVSNDTLALNNSYLDNMKYFGNYKLDGNVYSKNYSNVFNDTLTVLDTLANLYTSMILVNGDLVNKGSIINNPTGYPLHLQIKGNLTNHHVLNISNMYLIGTNPRTISGSNANGIQATILVDDSIRLIGNNTMPGISFTSNPKAWCVVDSNATLSILSISNPARILNFGKVSLTQNFDNTILNTILFYESSIRTKAGVSMNKLTIDHYGYQQHPTATGTVNNWWRLRNYPQNYNDSLLWLKLNYKTNALNGNLEDSLKVFFSPNAGLSWNKITSGVSIDTATNTVTVNNAPSYGHYLLSSTPLGITTFQPMVESVEPKFGGNTGYVTLYIFGAGLKNNSIVKLRLSGHADIVADTSYLTDAIGESMFARFDLKNKTIGVYDVVIETPGENTLIKTACFNIIQGQRSEPWVSLTGRDRFLLNRWQTFNLNYGNSSNTDANGTMLVYVVNDISGLEVTFPDINIVLPKGIIDLGPDYTRIADSVAIYYVTDTLTGYIGQNMRVYPFYIPTIPAGSSSDVRVKVKLNGNGTLQMSAWMMDPFWENIDFSSKETESMPDEVRACITAAAMKSFSTGVIGLIPGMSCYQLVDKIVDPMGYVIPESMTPDEAPNTWGSWIWNKVSWAGSITQCATSFIPGIGQAVSIGIGMTNMIIDMKDGSDANEGCWRKFRNKSKTKKDSRGVNSFDPNEIVGPQGFAADNYISSKGNTNYRIYFENKDTASASALEVFVKDTLDITKFDLNTFSFNTVTFGDTTVKIQDYAKEFTVLVDMYPTKDIIVQVHGALNTINGAISWDFHSLDRITLELTEDPDLGFLSPNVIAPEGEGNVAFSCKLKETVAHDALIKNKASIVFDFNAPINTNTYSNMIDTLAPVSSVNTLSSIQTDSSFTVSWSGSDQGCGILNYNIFVSENDSDYVLWKAATNNTSAVFAGNKGHNYKFFCIASDSIGLTEAQKLTPEAVTTVSTGIQDVNNPVSQFQFYPNPAINNVILDINLISAQNVWVEVIDMYGKKLIMDNYSELPSGKNLKRIKTDRLNNGVYNIILHTNKSILMKKLMICR
ncbi:MAG: T9SS type A sorting domain-containing protein [Bacteroidetes bacterium]|nr:T9SS type A sorting domain-containing protein [Bacteroidota bacterium]